MSQERIQCIITESPNRPDLVGETRFYGPADGWVFQSRTARDACLHVSDPSDAANGIYRTAAGTVLVDVLRLCECAKKAAADCAGGLKQCMPQSFVPSVPVAPSQAFKADEGKPNWFLLMSAKGCASALAAVVRVLTFAVAAKPVGKGYTPHSWREVPNAKERYEAALYRHLSYMNEKGEMVDPESGESHWAHVATNALFLAELHKDTK